MRYKKLDLEIRYKNLGVFERLGYREIVRLEIRYKKLDLKMSYKKLDLKMRYFWFIATALSRNVRLGCIKSGSSLTMVRLEMRYKS